MPEIIVKLGDSIVQKNIFVKETIRIGRVPDNEIVVENLAVSRYHSIIEHEDGRYILSDLDSSNGTFVNGVRIKKTELQDRDVITIGKHKLYFYDQRAGAELKPKASAVDVERTMLVEQQAPPAQAELEIVKGRQKGTRFVINGNQTSIGRGSFNEIQLTDWFVSKVHAVIERRGSEFIIRDLGSWRHTFVNNIMIHELPLADGDLIQMGPTVQLSFNLMRPDQPLTPPARVPVELAPAEKAPQPAWPESAADDDEDPGEATQKHMFLTGIKSAPPQSLDGTAPGEERELRPELDIEVENELGERAAAPLTYEAADEPIEVDAEDAMWQQPEPMPAAESEPQPAEPLPALDSADWLPELADDNRPTPIQEDAGETAQWAPAPASEPAPESAAETSPELSPELDKEIQMWERALQNKNPIIRKQAARQLQKLTGKQYEYS